MSNVETLIRAFSGWGKDEPGSIPECLHPDCELIVPDSMPFGGVRRGRQASLEFFTRELWEWFDEFSSTPEGLIDGGELIAVPVHVEAVGKNGRPMDAHNLWVYEFEDGLVIRARVYADTAASQETFAGFTPE